MCCVTSSKLLNLSVPQCLLYKELVGQGNIRRPCSSAASMTLACSPHSGAVHFTNPPAPSQQPGANDARGACDTGTWLFSSSTVQLCPYESPLLTPSILPKKKAWVDITPEMDSGSEIPQDQQPTQRHQKGP